MPTRPALTAPGNPAIRTNRTALRVRYDECDPMGVAHHGAYPAWLEIGRTEMCRDLGVSYRDLESEGTLVAVVSLEMRYRRPVRYDDEITVETELVRITRAKMEHRYRVLRGGVECAAAATVTCCIGRDGRPREIPAILRPEGTT